MAKTKAKKVSKPNVVDTAERMAAAVGGMMDDVVSNAAGNKSAGSRVRKACQEIKVLAQQLRKEVLALRG